MKCRGGIELCKQNMSNYIVQIFCIWFHEAYCIMAFYSSGLCGPWVSCFKYIYIEFYNWNFHENTFKTVVFIQ